MRHTIAAVALVLVLACSACSSGEKASAASDDARTACALLRGLRAPLPEHPADSSDTAGLNAADSVLYRLGAAEELAAAAALADSGYRALSDAVHTARIVPATEFRNRAAEPYIKEALTHC
ncbi:hypothetical protein ACFVHB_10830 [Kitasatospora sp. NPDC127111]|uniref:hypothetical protein n=1 Tax=Kitasatospora sp. NPDC127111 TaxID=3345363 RepID=UPI003636668D